jgi:hypothetical protein
MLGLRGSGKTTFLAALWHYLESAELDDELDIPQLQPDRDYLNSIRNSWLALQPVGRTSLRANTTVSMALRDKTTNTDVKISIPDLSGESFRLQWSKRKAPASYVSFAKECAGAFLFIHPKDVKRTHAIKAAAIDIGDNADENLSRISPTLNWLAETSSTQVQIVDIIQLLIRMREITRPMRLAVIISAWDLIKDRISPVGWLESRLPLLSQFLRANQKHFASETYGISAQGGDLVENRTDLLAKTFASKRCIAWRGDTLESVSIATPLRFIA